MDAKIESRYVAHGYIRTLAMLRLFLVDTSIWRNISLWEKTTAAYREYVSIKEDV